MVAAEVDGELVLGRALAADFVDVLACLGDCLAALVEAGGGRFFGVGYVDVAFVVDLMSQAQQAALETGVTQRVGTHVDAKAILTQVHGNVDDANGSVRDNASE